MMRRAATSSAKRYTGDNYRQHRRRLIVDTDLGMDDLVALAILRVQQCMHESHLLNSKGKSQQYTPFQLSGVTITPGISCANVENAALLRRLLPPNTPVYVSGSADKSLSLMDGNKPVWWTRTAHRVKSFLSSLPPLSTHQSAGIEQAAIAQNSISAEEFIANNMDDQDVDFLCMAPLSTVAKAIRTRSEQQNKTSPLKATFYIMGGIRSDSKMTKRGESTAPFGYHDPIGESAETATSEKQDTFGEFNFALDIDAARAVLSNISARIIPLEACTLVPKSLRSLKESVTLVSILKDIQSPASYDTTNCDTESANEELHVACNNILKLLLEFGTAETQWDSISAAIYCNVFGTASCDMLNEIHAKELSISDLGALSFPGCGINDLQISNDARNSQGCHQSHFIYPAFTQEDESNFFRYISFLLRS